MINPIETTESVRDSYLRYLRSNYPFQDMDLRDAFQQAIAAPEALVKGPILESTPPFKTGSSIARFVDDRVLNENFESLCSSEMPYERPFYLHQEEAIRKVVSEERNLVVATGTGSGKTEAFLVPIFNHLLNERDNGTLSEPGVRALLLYPMNALVNDQLKRLRGILEDRDVPITFGRYTGETKHEREDAEAAFRSQFPDEPIIENELLCRNEMRDTPPHILVTNYAMLEYLLLRPEDHIFFENQADTWKFLVLDEAHTYDGAVGIELGMLMRRLKDRISASSLTCVATSATIGGGEEDFSDVAQFAQNLFGEPFSYEDDPDGKRDVIKAKRLPAKTTHGTAWGSGTSALYRPLRTQVQALSDAITNEVPDDEGGLPAEQAIEDGWIISPSPPEDQPASKPIQELRQAVETAGMPRVASEAYAATDPDAPAAAQVGEFLFHVLKGDQRLHDLREHLAGSPHDVRQIAHSLFPEDENPEDTLTDLVRLAVRAREHPEDPPLLPARYHVFAKALEGAFACLNASAHDDHAPYLSLKRYENCPSCSGSVQELASCKFCGATYIVADVQPADRPSHFQIQHIKLRTGHPSTGARSYLLLADAVADHDEDEEIAVNVEDELGDHLTHTFCTGCGISAVGVPLTCNCKGEADRIRVHEVKIEGDEPPKQCLACQKRSSRSVLYRFLTGQDAPVSVLATRLYQALPPSNSDQHRAYPGEGRKLLTFADSRQDAAFFAPFMQRTYDRILHRRLLFKSLCEHPHGPSGDLQLPDLILPLRKTADEVGVFGATTTPLRRKREVSKWLVGELVAWDTQKSLEGVGLLRFDLAFPDNWSPPQPLQNPPWNLSSSEAQTLITVLLNTLRRQGAVTMPEGVDARDDYFKPRNRPLFVNGSRSDRKQGILSWSPVRGSNKRLDFLKRVLKRQNPDIEEQRCHNIASDTLRGLWSHLTQNRSREWEPYWTVDTRTSARQLTHRQWHVTPLTNPSGYWCDQCGERTHHSVAQTCTAMSCTGTLHPVDGPPQTAEHYRALYQDMTALPLAAEEHTAQWTSEKASQVQSDFINGKVNLLSCSTTFELGVDLGGLQSVLMRNVPPSTANYVQRAGRAGRRTDAAALVMTFAQRRSHDLTHYRNPMRMVGGHVAPPRIAIANPKIVRRHMQAILIADFLWQEKQRVGHNRYRQVSDFFLSGSEDDISSDQTGATRLREFAESHPERILKAFQRIVPEKHDLHRRLGLEEWEWLRTDEGDGMLDLLDRIQQEVQGDATLYQELIHDAIEAENLDRAVKLKNALRTIESRNLISFFASRGLLPKYGFPTDVVEMRTDHVPTKSSRNVELQRDLRIAIGEYAPGSEVVAGGQVWTGGGLRTLPDKEWPKYEYAQCPNCERFTQALHEIPDTCPGCGEALSRRGEYLIPEFGFVAGRKVKRTGGRSPRRGYPSKVYFDDYEGEYPDMEVVEELCAGESIVKARYSRFGRLVVVNSGSNNRGFKVCFQCGYGMPTPDPDSSSSVPETHDHPRTGRSCSGTLYTYHLGHNFLTDVAEFQIWSREVEVGASLLYALLEGAAQELNISRDDIDGTLYWSEPGRSPSLVLFDSVPGGAGHVRRVVNNAAAVFHAAHAVVSQDCCGAETSCYECLRTYRNQSFHDNLVRGRAQNGLGYLVDNHFHM